MFGRCDSYRPLSGKHLVRMVVRNDNCWEVSEVLALGINVLRTSFGIVWLTVAPLTRLEVLRCIFHIRTGQNVSEEF